MCIGSCLTIKYKLKTIWQNAEDILLYPIRTCFEVRLESIQGQSLVLNVHSMFPFFFYDIEWKQTFNDVRKSSMCIDTFWTIKMRCESKVL